jgi:hypothetical protein
MSAQHCLRLEVSKSIGDEPVDVGPKVLYTVRLQVGQILGGPLTKLLDAIANLASVFPAGTIVNP